MKLKFKITLKYKSMKIEKNAKNKTKIKIRSKSEDRVRNIKGEVQYKCHIIFILRWLKFIIFSLRIK